MQLHLTAPRDARLPGRLIMAAVLAEVLHAQIGPAQTAHSLVDLQRDPPAKTQDVVQAVWVFRTNAAVSAVL